MDKGLREHAEFTLTQAQEDDAPVVKRLVDVLARVLKEDDEPVPIRLHCPICGELHIDEGVHATKPHHTHACQGCGNVWRPAKVNTVGVRFLPGYKNETIAEMFARDVANRRGA